MTKEIVPVKTGPPPMVVDFSQKAIGKAVLNRTLQHPITVYPMALGVPAAALLAVLFKLPLLLTAGIALGSVGFGAISFIWNQFFRYDNFAGFIARELREQLERQKEESVGNLKEGLLARGLEQGAEQITHLEKKFDNLVHIIEQKFNDGELTYMRYLGMAEQLRFSVLDNLRDVLPIADSVSAINTDMLTKRIQELSGKPDSSKELQALQDRIMLYDEQHGRIKDIFSTNESALTELDKTAAAVSSVRTMRGEASTSMEQAMLELQELAQRTRKYEVQ